MFGLGLGEIVIILVLALILLGPERLPDVAKQLGKGLRDFKRATEDLKDQFEREIYTDESRPASRPSLVPQPPVPTQPPAPVPAATPENVPGLDAAKAEPAPPPAPADPGGGSEAGPAGTDAGRTA